MTCNQNVLTQKLQIANSRAKRIQNLKFWKALLILVVLTGIPFYKAYTLIKLSVKWLRKNEFYSIQAILILGLASIISPIALSHLTTNITINNTGNILTIKTPITYKSEIRGVFFHESIFGCTHNWTTIADTLAEYSINMVLINMIGKTGQLRPSSEWTSAINAFHSHNIEVHVSWNVLGDVAYNETCKAEDHAGNKQNWNSPIKIYDVVNQTLHAALAYNIDGIMLDYIRYSEADQCYCSECRAAFEEWLNEGTITDWTQFYTGGARWSEYAEWRTLPINNIVKLIHDEAKKIRSNITISEAAWTLFSDSPTYWRKWIGQDTGRWIKEGWIDFVAPMMYTKTVYGATGETLQSYIDADLKYMTGGVEGKLPHVAFLRVDWTSADLTGDEFKAQVDYVRSRGLDGWIIFRYGGPGDAESNPDIRNYLSAIDLPNTFSIRNIQVLANNETSATINWFTDLPATSKIEYSTSPLFNASWEIQSGFHYWKINYASGTIVQDSMNVTQHSITLTNLSPNTTYYFRVQSRDESGIVTSKVTTFTTSG